MNFKKDIKKDFTSQHGNFFIWLFIALLILSSFSCDKAPAPSKNILFIVVDTLRADHMGIYGYERETTPALDWFAKDAVVFNRAYSHSPWTTPSVASMFTSLVPRDHGIKTIKQPLELRFLTLAEHLKTHGYHTEAYVSHVVFRPRFNFNQGFEVFDYSVLEKGKPSTITSSEEISDLAISSLNRNIAQPFFLWLHYFDPHSQYIRHKQYRYGRKPMDRYDGEIRFTDYHIGRVIDTITQLKLLEETVIVFLSDHGEEFLDHGGRYHARTLFEELIHIPLIIRVPGYKPAQIDTVVAEIDIAPTICKLVGVPVPEEFKGQSFGIKDKSFHIPENRIIFAETYKRGDKRGVLHENWKLIHDREIKRFELFNLKSDPGEKENVLDKYALVAKHLTSLLEAHYAKKRTQVLEIELSEKLKRELKSLGYIK